MYCLHTVIDILYSVYKYFGINWELVKEEFAFLTNKMDGDPPYSDYTLQCKKYMYTVVAFGNSEHFKRIYNA